MFARSRPIASLLAVVVAVAVAGCGQPGSPAPGERRPSDAPTASAPKTLTIALDRRRASVHHGRVLDRERGRQHAHQLPPQARRDLA
jgi:hypothetical protein